MRIVRNRMKKRRFHRLNQRVANFVSCNMKTTSCIKTLLNVAKKSAASPLKSWKSLNCKINCSIISSFKKISFRTSTPRQWPVTTISPPLSFTSETQFETLRRCVVGWSSSYLWWFFLFSFSIGTMSKRDEKVQFHFMRSNIFTSRSFSRCQIRRVAAKAIPKMIHLKMDCRSLRMWTSFTAWRRSRV